MKHILLTCSVILFSIICCTAQSENPCPCCSEDHRAFDFWVGDWNVYNNSGKLIGTNNVVVLQDGCIVQENWEASDGTNTGTSYNFFDTADSTWNQIWVSNSGNVLYLKGNIDPDGSMVLSSELIEGSKGTYYNQIRWAKNKDGTVTQRWDILNTKDELISKAFEGIYKK